MTETELELESLFKGMLEEIKNLIEQKDEILIQDLKDYSMEIQWIFDGIKGYTIFKNGTYNYKIGGELKQPDLALKFPDLDVAARFLRDELKEYSYVYYKRKFKLYYPESREEIEKETGPVIVKHLKHLLTAHYLKGVFYHPFVLSKIPVFRKIIEKFYVPEEIEGSYIPINTKLGDFNNQTLPQKLIEYFIDKTNYIYVSAICGCRLNRDCQDHESTIGCMYLGDDVKNLKHPPEKGRFLTREEAKTHVKKAIESGLVPTFGRFIYESTSLSVEDTGHFMSMCFCCPCCCINGKLMQNSTSMLYTRFKRMEGITVEVDSDKCVGCGICLDVCCFVGRNIINDKAVIDQERCLGCGRCERVCPNGAINITLDDPKRLDEFIKRIESSVDVS
ncbi:MAG: 4Fe-4S binding protein [Candidatus Lokiarchaeota archaeon]|nr:4Fe-4S binding protein [Candidatus Lokiarchaeota archaeon]